MKNNARSFGLFFFLLQYHTVNMYFIMFLIIVFLLM